MSSSGVTRSAVATLKRSHETRRSNVASAKSPVAASLDLKEAIESARKTFKRDVKTSAPTTPATSLSPRTTIPHQQQQPKSASAPASPIKRPESVPNSAKRSRLEKTPTVVPSKRPRRSVNSQPSSITKSASTNDASLSPKGSDDTAIACEVKNESSQKKSRPTTPVLAEETAPKHARKNKKSTCSVANSDIALATENNIAREDMANQLLPKSSNSNETASSNINETSKSKATDIEMKSKESVATDDNVPAVSKVKTQSITSNAFDDDSKRRPSHNVSMLEVIKLHRDEGVMHLLHALPSSRRKPTQMVAVVSRRPSANGLEPRTATAAATSSQPSRCLPDNQQQQKQQLSIQNPNSENSTGQVYPKFPMKKVLQDRPTNLLTSHLERAQIKPCTQEELMSSHALSLIKQLPSKEYIRLWSSPSRYVIVNDESSKKSSSSAMMTVQTSTNVTGVSISVTGVTPNGSTSSPSSSVSSDMSSVSAPRHHMVHQLMPRSWTINSKNFKDILIRTYPTFAQILISPVTTGLKNSLNSNVCEEIMDALRQLGNEHECRAILVTGIGPTFCQGVDLTVLTYDSPDRQRRSAENLANSIKKLITFMLSYQKILLAAVNGVARGIGFTLLPYFDHVFASDKATFCADYVRLGQIPEAFASHSFVAGHLALSEILLFGKTATASEASRYGLVSSVVWPDKFLEEIVPRVEMLETMATSGLTAVKMNMKQSLRKAVNQSVMEEETKLLVKNWTHPLFAKTVRTYLKTNRLSFQ